MQGALVIMAVPEQVKGRALGLLSLAIASNVPGTLVFAELAERIGTYRSLHCFAVAGCLLHTLWYRVRPQAMRIRRREE